MAIRLAKLFVDHQTAAKLHLQHEIEQLRDLEKQQDMAGKYITLVKMDIFETPARDGRGSKNVAPPRPV